MPSIQISRIIDVNLDRAGEGLRVMEEIARFALDDPALSARLKELRHQVALRDLQARLNYMSARNSDSDVGENIKTTFQASLRGLLEITIANAHRAEESLRVLEELAPSAGLDSQLYASSRYQLYTLEKELLGQLSRRDKAQRIKGHYFIVDTNVHTGQDIMQITAQILAGGAKLIQLRDKAAPKGELLQIASQMQKLCAENDATFIVNNHLDVALASNADGLHLGQGDMPVAEARRFLPLGKIIGCSIASSIEAQKAQQDEADYISYRVGFNTPTEYEAKLEAIKTIKRATRLPLVAINDNNLRNIAGIVAAGADATTVESSVILTHSLENTISEKAIES